ncbi:hypothetical protein [Paenibacillus auburnensis]|uniref:hypothetical protein n=1 Tax=Paenibacillus auburnensis TaxID=2905649 RepID=UPI001F27ED45|nr:hypothetical protein [Paenibacillus auburnensis]
MPGLPHEAALKPATPSQPPTTRRLAFLLLPPLTPEAGGWRALTGAVWAGAVTA